MPSRHPRSPNSRRSSRTVVSTSGLPLVAVVGRANVGKSTLFNRLVGRNVAVTSPIAGTTRDRVSADVAWRSRDLTLVDTGGLDVGPGAATLEQQVLAQARTALDAADLVLFVVDARAGVTPVDRRVARELRKRRADVMLVASKAEARGAVDLHELSKIGFGEPQLVSGASGVGTGDLLDAVVERLAATAPRRSQALASGRLPAALSLAFVGRPNVGKSSLVNALLGTERVIVNDLPGTTRDTTSSLIEHAGQQYVLLDTAGLVRPGAAQELARYAALRSIKSLRAADVGILVLDANELITAADKRVARNLLDAHRPIIVVLNKSDLVAPAKHDALLEYVRAMLPLMSWADMIIVSAKTKRNLGDIYRAADAARATFEEMVDVDALEELTTSVKKHWIARGKGPKSAKLLALRQVKVAPPTFVASVDDPQAVHFSYLRFLENKLRKRFGLAGTPLQIVVRKGILRRP